MRALAVIAVLLLLLAGCGATQAAWSLVTGSGGAAAAGASGDPVDQGLAVVQWALGLLGLGGAGFGVQAIRRVRQATHGPSRAAGDLADLRRAVEAWEARVLGLEGRVARIETILMSQGRACVPPPAGA